MSRAAAFFAGVAALAVAGCGPQRPALPPGTPSLLLITLDTTRADRLGCYGYPAATSTAMDSLAREGVVFRTAIAQAAVTPVSHASILTGLEPQNHGLRVIHAGRGFRLAREVPVLAEIVKNKGWQTAAFLSSFTVSEHFGLDRGFETWDNGLAVDPGEALRREADGKFMWDVRANQRRADDTADRFIAWLRNNRRPFFAWVHFWDPHDSALVPPEEIIREFVPPGVGPVRRKLAMYDAEVRFVDLQVERIREALERLGHAEDTVVAIVADHGEGLLDHDWWHHRILYQEQIRVPMILKFPEGPAGLVVDDVVRTTDLFPTFMELLGVASAPETDGRSLLPLVRGEPEEGRVAYAEALNRFDLNARWVLERPGDDLLHAVVAGDWKLIYRPLAPETSELYDLTSDPKETRNRYGAEPDRVRELLAYLKSTGGLSYPDFGASVDDEALERLRSLGYVGADAERPED